VIGLSVKNERASKKPTDGNPYTRLATTCTRRYPYMGYRWVDFKAVVARVRASSSFRARPAPTRSQRAALTYVPPRASKTPDGDAPRVAA